MKYYFFAILIVILSVKNITAQSPKNTTDKIKDLKGMLSKLAEQADNKFFELHCNSMLMVINSVDKLSKKDKEFLNQLYDAFKNDSLDANPENFDSYLQRKRSMVIAWVSPTDNSVSFSWLKLPKNWDPEKEYPLYVELHGLWKVAADPINYLCYPYLEPSLSTTAFEDGYLLSPWGRGNLWYQGIAEKDIWECISFFEKHIKINQNRRYLCGFSMGGFGTWSIASKSVDTWAAIGLHSAALRYKNASLVNFDIAKKLKDKPIYFVWGSKETFLKKKNIELIELLKKAGNQNVKSVTFEGGHDYSNPEVERMYNWMKQFSKK